MDLSPIVLFVYNRLWHIRQTVEALASNEFANASKLIIYSDGPKDDKERNDVNRVRGYLKTISGFKDIIVIEREKNLGLTHSIIDGVTDVVNQYERVIVLEDDLISSPYFLRYMNEALDFYEKEDRVISVHGYVFPVEKELPETFFLKGADCWGWATWRRAWNLLELNGERLLKELLAKHLQREFDFGGAYNYTKMLKDQIAYKDDSWAIRWYASAFLKDRLTLYPGRSLICNIGNDSSGMHCGTTDVFNVSVSDRRVDIKKIDITEDLKVRKIFGDFLRSTNPPFHRRVFRKLVRYLRKG